ncbi:hypothetical protein V6N12_043678 [Hibiscus sabdariffa]|uniref:Uncharacterized protein n=1 Tax=Hibiscus sabdariffa TaxID=183260 RepID=A0ABR2DFZ9_9ROSI
MATAASGGASIGLINNPCNSQKRQCHLQITMTSRATLTSLFSTTQPKPFYNCELMSVAAVALPTESHRFIGPNPVENFDHYAFHTLIYELCL